MVGTKTSIHRVCSRIRIETHCSDPVFWEEREGKLLSSVTEGVNLASDLSRGLGAVQWGRESAETENLLERSAQLLL